MDFPFFPFPFFRLHTCLVFLFDVLSPVTVVTIFNPGSKLIREDKQIQFGATAGQRLVFPIHMLEHNQCVILPICYLEEEILNR